MPIPHFKVTEERTELLPMGVYRRLDKDPAAQMAFIAHFLVDDDGAYVVRIDDDTGRYLGGQDKAWEILDPLPVRQIKDIIDQINSTAEEVAVPKA